METVRRDCPRCGKNISVTKSGKLRVHSDPHKSGMNCRGEEGIIPKAQENGIDLISSPKSDPSHVPVAWDEREKEVSLMNWRFLRWPVFIFLFLALIVLIFSD